MKYLCVLCVFCGLIPSAGALDREAFTLTKYDLDVRVEPEQQRLGVRGKITLRNDSPSPQKNAALQVSSSLSWRSIQVSGKPVQFTTHEYTSDIDHTGALSEAIVSLPQEIPPKGNVELDIGYEGVITLDATRLTRIGVPEEKAEHSDWDQIGKLFTAVRGIGYVAWYPIATEAGNLSEGNSVFEAVGRWKATQKETTMRVNLCTRDVSSQFGLMNDVSEAPTGVGVSWAVWSVGTGECSNHNFQPVGAVVPVLVEGNYAQEEKGQIGFRYLAQHKAAAEDYALAAELVGPLVKEWFGKAKHGAELVDLADSEAAPFESGNMLLMPLSRDDTRLFALTAVHQLTHGAFPSPRLWIYEGLAHFAQALEREQQDGRQAALDFMGLHRTAISEADRTMVPRQDREMTESLINTETEEFYRSKAMYVWWMLRDMVGESAMKKALAEYKPDQDKQASYMQGLVEAQSHRDLEWFFDDWVYRDRGLPDFRVESAYARPTVNGAFVVTVTVEDLGAAGAEVPVRLQADGGDITKRVEVHGKSKAVVRFETPSLAREVIVNDGSVPESDMSNNTYEIKLPPQ